MRSGRAVLVQHKYDGTRVFAFNSDGRILMASRHNGVYQAQDYPNIFRELTFPRRTILDGELIEKEDRVVFFDIITLEGKDLRFQPLPNRLIALEGALHTLGKHVSIAPSFPANTAVEVQQKFDEAVKLGYEGVVVKDVGAVYGSKDTWLKLKNYVTDDLVVLRGHDTEGSARTGIFVSWTLGAFDEKGVLVDVVDAYANRVEVQGLVKPGDVVEVRHQPTEGFSRLRHPVILRIRTDKTPEECLLSQVKFKPGLGVK